MIHCPPRARILILDNQRHHAQDLGGLLEQAGYEVYVAEDDKRLLNLATRVVPELILLGIETPPTPRFALARRLREALTPAETPILFLTDDPSPELVESCFEAGAVDIIRAPRHPAIVRRRVGTHITLAQRTRRLQSFTECDGLTGLANLRRFRTVLELDWRRCRQDHRPIAAALANVDFFKDYNLAHGHLAGDDALRRIGAALESACARTGDLVARFGPEEFVALLPGADAVAARLVAERLRKAVADLTLPHPSSRAGQVVTVSLGFASRMPDDDSGSPEQLLESAARALLQAKHAGRNRVAG
jgi:diguanylate cyclase (GGDEF)-like protein